MKKVGESQFVSDYGFKSNSFSVDSAGNITANSINVVEGGSVDTSVPNFIFTDDSSSNFLVEDYVGNNPTLEIIKSRTFVFRLNLTNTGLYFLKEDQTTFYTTGIIHSSGDQGVDAQGKLSGTISITVPASYTEETIYYSNQSRSIFGTINISEPVGSFSTVSIKDTTNATSATTGALTVAGGIGVEKDLFIGGELNIQGLGIPVVSSTTNLTLAAGNKIVVNIDDVLIGEIDENGSSIPLNNTTIDATVIGGTTPSSAAFTSATITTSPTTSNDVANKNYVDNTVAALAIALGI